MAKAQETRDMMDREAQAIWHIAELLGKLGGADDDEVTLSAAALRYFSREIEAKLSRLVECVEK